MLHTTANVYGMPPQQSAQAIVTDDFAWIKLRLYSATGYSNIRFAVWSSAGGQDDLVWYNAQGGKRPHAAAAYPLLFGDVGVRLIEPNAAPAPQVVQQAA